MRNNIILYILLLTQLTVSCKSSVHSGKQGEQENFHAESNSFFDFFYKENKETENIERRELTPFEYVQWVRDVKNGLRVIKREGVYIYELQYQPV